MTASETLLALLEVWGRCGGHAAKSDAELIKAIERAGDRAARGVAVKGDWLAAAKRNDPVERGRLLVTASEAPPPKLLARWTALAKSGDPRVTGKLVDQSLWNTKEMLRRYLNLLVDGARDRRTVETLARFAKPKKGAHVGDRGKMIAAAYDRAKKAQKALATEPLGKADKALVTAALAGGDARDGDGDGARGAELLAAVYADPADDGARSVYADWLLEQGDPRGEFITLQLAREKRSLSKTEDARMDELEAAHAKTWLGPIWKVSQDVLWERGFVSCVRWHAYKAGLPDDPVWSTVTATTHLPPKSALRTLTFVMHADSEDVARLGELPADSPLDSLHWDRVKPGKPRDRAIAAYKKAKLPALTNLEITGDYDASWAPANLGWLFAGRALTDVTVLADPARLADYLALFEEHALEQLALDVPHGNFRLSRTGGKLELWILAVDNDAVEGALAGLATLPANKLAVAKLNVSSKSARVREQFAEVLARHAKCKVAFEK